MSIYRVEIFDFGATLDLLDRHGRDFQAAEEISAQPLEVTANETPPLAWRLFFAESNRNVVKGEAAITRQNQPRAKTDELSKAKERAQRQRR